MPNIIAEAAAGVVSQRPTTATVASTLEDMSVTRAVASYTMPVAAARLMLPLVPRPLVWLRGTLRYAVGCAQRRYHHDRRNDYYSPDTCGVR